MSIKVGATYLLVKKHINKKLLHCKPYQHNIKTAVSADRVIHAAKLIVCQTKSALSR